MCQSVGVSRWVCQSVGAAASGCFSVQVSVSVSVSERHWLGVSVSRFRSVGVYPLDGVSVSRFRSVGVSLGGCVSGQGLVSVCLPRWVCQWVGFGQWVSPSVGVSVSSVAVRVGVAVSMRVGM